MSEPQEASMDMLRTLEVLQSVLDPEAFQIAKASLEAEVTRRKEEKDRIQEYMMQSNLISGYDYAIEQSKAGYAHVEGRVIGASHQYLEMKANTEVTSELDRQVRLFAGCVVCKDTQDYDNPDELLNKIRAAQIEPDEVFMLIRKYWEEQGIHFGSSWPPRLEGLEDVIRYDVLEGDVTWDFLPSPGLAEQIRHELDKQKHHGIGDIKEE